MNDVVAGKARNIRDCVSRLRAVDPGTLEGIEREKLIEESLVQPSARVPGVDRPGHASRAERTPGSA